ncbi:MAG: hypothetical protein KGI06_02450 [Candidatus Micrarchaeota archaeon]|nr:hypothetical protein [Candidatus Micrarchaeota archaeon]
MQVTLYAMHLQSIALATLPISPSKWVVTSMIAVLAVIMVSAMVYMLSGIIQSERARVWSRFQIYEALFSAVLILAFGSITYIFFLNPQTVYGKLNLVPSTCTSAPDLYQLAACDVSLFNSASFAFSEYAFYASYLPAIISGIGPEFQIAPIPASPSINIEITAAGLFPTGTTSLLGILYATILFMLIFNQLQLMLIAGSLLFLSFFLTIGLIARTLGFLRSFGGAMIAFGLGLGIIYPLLVSLTYGYVDVAANLVCMQTASCALSSTWTAIWTTIFGVWSTGFSAIPAAVGTLFTDIGYIIAGLTIVPLLNIVIVDAFIIDFSKAVGEPMSFGQLFSNLL